MILHIPHASTKFPQNHQPISDLTKSLNQLTDWYTDEIFTSLGATRVVFDYSRLFCDVERLTNDPLEEVGRGICYKTGFDGEIIEFDVSDEDRKLFYTKHHNKLLSVCENQLSLIERCVIVDCHSFSPKQINLADDECPDICIGVNEKTTSNELCNIIVESFSDMGYKVKINYPFSNSILPWNDERIDGLETVMIEVNKKNYLSEDYKKGENFEKVKNDISKVLEFIKDYEFNAS